MLKDSASSQGMWSPELGWGVLNVAAAVDRASGVQAQTAGSVITLVAQVLKQPAAARTVRSAVVVATLHSAAPGVEPGARPVELATNSGLGWGEPVESTTLPNGQATWKLKLKKGTYRLRARWAGAGDLAGAVSATLVLKVL